MKAILEGGNADGQEEARYTGPVPRIDREHRDTRGGVISITNETYDLVTNEWGDPEVDTFGRVRYRVRAS